MKIPFVPLLRMTSRSTGMSSTATFGTNIDSNTATPTSLSMITTPSSQSIQSYIIGLNAALQKRFVIDIPKEHNNDLIPGNVYRASSISYGVGGKGQDVAYTLHCLQYNNDSSNTNSNTPYHLVQFIGMGYEGDTVYNKMMNDFSSSNNNNNSNKNNSCLSSCTVRTSSILRTCTSVVTSQSTTELIDPSGTITSNEINELLQKIHDSVDTTISIPPTTSNNNVRSLCFMGSMPPGCPSNLYGQIYNTIVSSKSSSSVLCFIDSVVGLDNLLKQIQLSNTHKRTKQQQESLSSKSTTTTILKINVAELCRYVNVPMEKESDGAKVESIVTAITKFWKQQQQNQQQNHVTDTSNDIALLQPNVIALTNGAHPAYLAILNQQPSQHSEEEEELSFDLYRLPIISPSDVIDIDSTTTDTSTGIQQSQRKQQEQEQKRNTLYPIGAGDAVAAGTFAAWNYYVATTSSSTSSSSSTSNESQILPESIRQVLDNDRSLWSDKKDIESGIYCHEMYISSFRFGLACGSASCIQEENSIVSIPHVTELYNKASCAGIEHTTHTIPLVEMTRETKQLV